VAFSSAGAGYGNAGLSNYGFGNSYMERVYVARAERGLPLKSILLFFIFLSNNR
jgi:hypothetical protein